jgi:hypothetical protein
MRDSASPARPTTDSGVPIAGRLGYDATGSDKDAAAGRRLVLPPLPGRRSERETLVLAPRQAAVSRRGSFQPGRGKWQLYPAG